MALAKTLLCHLVCHPFDLIQEETLFKLTLRILSTDVRVSWFAINREMENWVSLLLHVVYSSVGKLSPYIRFAAASGVA